MGFSLSFFLKFGEERREGREERRGEGEEKTTK
jgi:hypothetical protein